MFSEDPMGRMCGLWERSSRRARSPREYRVRDGDGLPGSADELGADNAFSVLVHEGGHYWGLGHTLLR
jgi:hypothetical protein